MKRLHPYVMPLAFIITLEMIYFYAISPMKGIIQIGSIISQINVIPDLIIRLIYYGTYFGTYLLIAHLCFACKNRWPVKLEWVGYAKVAGVLYLIRIGFDIVSDIARRLLPRFSITISFLFEVTFVGVMMAILYRKLAGEADKIEEKKWPGENKRIAVVCVSVIAVCAVWTMFLDFQSVATSEQLMDRLLRGGTIFDYIGLFTTETTFAQRINSMMLGAVPNIALFLLFLQKGKVCKIKSNAG